MILLGGPGLPHGPSYRTLTYPPPSFQENQYKMLLLLERLVTFSISFF